MRLMSESFETPTARTSTATAPAPPPATERKTPKVFKAAAWVAIVAGIVFIVSVIFFTGYALGKHGGHGGHHPPHPPPHPNAHPPPHPPAPSAARAPATGRAAEALRRRGVGSDRRRDHFHRDDPILCRRHDLRAAALEGLSPSSPPPRHVQSRVTRGASGWRTMGARLRSRRSPAHGPAFPRPAGSASCCSWSSGWCR